MDRNEPGGYDIDELVEEIGVGYPVGGSIDREEQEEEVGDVPGTLSAISMYNPEIRRVIKRT